ncbi:MAG: hypothetical protein NC402_01440 [Prevotella sp.]|nr:hypothetical protein [Prevotella sp.]MCM1074527.1 hypothetical protein [Ruminococcus sp.]
MKTRIIAMSAAIAVTALSFVSCQGRRADATPNGETVEVEIQSTLEEPVPHLQPDTIN